MTLCPDHNSPDKALQVKTENCAVTASPVLPSSVARDKVRLTQGAGTVLKHQSSRQSVKRCATPNSGWL